MLAVDLEKAINSAKEEGKCPMAVMTTAGTTVLGAFDSFTEIAAICRKHNLWLHIDVSRYNKLVFTYRCMLYRELWEVQL